MKKIILISILIVVLLIAGCGGGSDEVSGGAVTDTSKAVVTSTTDSPKCPDCNDNDKCTQDICNEGTNYECAYRVIAPCCGNDECESTENNDICPADCEKPTISEELQKAIAGQQKIKSYKYTLYGNLIADKIYVKGNKMRYDLSKNKQKDFVSIGKFDSIYLDKTKKQAYLSCIDITCEDRYVLEAADYDEYIMETPMEMIEGVSYKSDITATEMCDVSKPCNKVEVQFADGKTGNIWIDNYYGFPLKIEKSGKIYEFVAVAVNAVKDGDVELP